MSSTRKSANSSDDRATRQLGGRLEKEKPASAEEELRVLRQFLGTQAEPSQGQRKRKAKAGAKTTLRIAHAGSMVKCVAADGRIELKGETDYSAIDRATLEAAINAFLDVIQAD